MAEKSAAQIRRDLIEAEKLYSYAMSNWRHGFATLESVRPAYARLVDAMEAGFEWQAM